MNATKNYIGNNTTTRRTKAKTTAPTDRRLYLLDEAKQRHCRNTKKPKEISSCESTSNGFLKTTFLPKFRENDSLKLFGKSRKDLNQIQRKNAKKESDFYQSLSQLAEHYGIYPMETKDFEYPYNISLSIWDVKKKLNEKVEHWDHIRLVRNGDKTHFTSNERYNTNATLYYIPVIPLYKMLKDKNRKKTAQLLLSVCSYLYRNINIPYYRQEDSYLYWTYEMLSDWIEEDEEVDENHFSKKELLQAEIIGDFMEQKISHTKNIEFFRQRLNQFILKDDFDKECFQLSEKAYQLYNDYPDEQFFRNAKYNNISNQKNKDEDNDGYSYDEEETVVSMDKYVSFYADDKGLIHQNIIDSVNNEFNEYGELQEPIIFKNFDGSPLNNDNLDFEDHLFELINHLTFILSNYNIKPSEK
ncbi:hypothetical protein [Chryseobacterium balustinum]|uniref:hypothetical protein n=1 Tax=Chryseobacterium balustinum TaxID=246 RepID=UPI003CEC35CF